MSTGQSPCRLPHKSAARSLRTKTRNSRAVTDEPRRRGNADEAGSRWWVFLTV
jgi:hypothetical protein